MSKPVIFVGSSSEQLALVTHLLIALEDAAVVKPWKQAFTPGETTLDALVANANEADFALFVFGPDDWTESRSATVASPRDNVVFEAGLFGGLLGWGRSIIVHAKGVKLPSDLLGLTLIGYDAGGDPEHQAQLVGAKIGGVIARKGWRGSESLAGQMAGDWWQYQLSAGTRIERSALSLIHVAREDSGLVLGGQAWTRDGRPHAQFRSRAASVNEESRTLFYYWEGDWPGHPDAPQFFGKGEIVLENTQRASGYFTIRSDGDPDPRERKRVVYERATAEELEGIRSADPARRSATLEKQLDKLEDFVFAGPTIASPPEGRPVGR